MEVSPVFRTAFWAGMAAPVSLFAPAAAYAGSSEALSPAQSFSIVGGLLSDAAQQFENDSRAVS